MSNPFSIYEKYGHIFEKQTTKLLSWRIYISIDFMVTTPLLSRNTVRPKRHLKKKMARCHLFAQQTPKLLSISLTWKIYSIHYVNSDKQTNKLFFLVHPVHFYFLVVPDYASHVAWATHSDHRLVNHLKVCTVWRSNICESVLLLYPHTDLPIPSALYAPLNLVVRNSGHSPRQCLKCQNYQILGARVYNKNRTTQLGVPSVIWDHHSPLTRPPS